ncbi:DNA helicase II [Escherichia coli]|nr:DNA helicase II [Escherichia coli]
MPLHVQTDRVIKDSGLRTMYEQEKGEKGQTRIENLEELVTATRQFSYNEEDEDLMPLQAFLSHAALEAGEGQADTWQDAVQLMTLHSAKGLEFPQVFIVGMEEGMFPSQMSLDEGGRLEEERRLAYVGVTRAMQKLTLTYAETRRLYGKEVYHRPVALYRRAAGRVCGRGAPARHGKPPGQPSADGYADGRERQRLQARPARTPR